MVSDFAAEGVDESLSQILAVLVLSDKGERVAVRYTPSTARHAAFATYKAQRAFETELVDKATKQGAKTGNGEIIIHRDYTSVYMSVNNELHLVVIGDPNENELLLLDVMNALYSALDTITGHRLQYDVLVCKMDMLLTVFDELLEGSMIYELDPELIVARAEMSESGSRMAPVANDASSAFNQALSAAKEGLMRGLWSGM